MKKLLFITLLILTFLSCKKDLVDNSKSTTNSDLNLMKRAQKDVFKYFYDYAHPNSKLARERIHENDLSFDQNVVTIGGSGFGFLNILLGIENGFISRTQGINHLETALNFLESADRFHGAWPHWINGNSGEVIPFSSMDNGGDIVETALLSQALICIREYFKNGNTTERQLSLKADDLWKSVEWDWYTNEENHLYWHWSPEFQWQMNFKIEGYNETLIAYILAAASPTYPISAETFHNGWAKNGGILSSVSNYEIPLIFDHKATDRSVGPLFWAHYSYLALDPRGLNDTYANYWDVVKNHTEIIYQHCVQNPNQFLGYSTNCWGLTASYSRNTDGSTGYSAHQPNNDRGVISPTAALSSIPYTPEKSMRFLRFLYEDSNQEYLGTFGPYDAFSIHYQWKIKRYLAIDQGTIGPMIENHKTQLFWNLFMNAPEIREGLINLGFSSTQHGF
ncbi:MAG: glucoamylase family protein [Flavobacteriaceae bacterium]